MNIFHYSIFGLVIATPFPCPNLSVVSPSAAPDISVLEGPVPYQLENPVIVGPRWEIDPGRYLFRGGARAGRFLAEGGTRVTLQSHPGADQTLQSAAFLGNVLAALLRQRGHLILHANTALTPRGAVSISGLSGAGKSTTTTALLQFGCRMLADDITVLKLSSPGLVEIIPGLPQLNLTDDAAQKLGIDASIYPRHGLQSAKVIVSTHSYMEDTPSVMQALYILEKADVNALQVRILTGREKLAALNGCVYGPMLPQEHPAAFPILSALLEKVPVFSIVRPLKKWTMNELTRIILSDVSI